MVRTCTCQRHLSLVAAVKCTIYTVLCAVSVRLIIGRRAGGWHGTRPEAKTIGLGIGDFDSCHFVHYCPGLAVLYVW